MILINIFAIQAFSKIDESVFHLVSLHSSNFSINFNKMTLQFPDYFTISPSSLHPKFEFHNIRAIKSFTPFLFLNRFSKFDLSITNSHFSRYLSTVILQNNDDYQQIVDENYNNDLKKELYSKMQSFENSNPNFMNISNCTFQDITGNQYNNDISAALCLFARHGGEIIITDSKFINCRSEDLRITHKYGGGLYILTSGNQHYTIEMKNLLFEECNSFQGAAFTIKSDCPINYTQTYCRNINVTRCINLPEEEYFDLTRNIVDINNCLIEQFANVLFEDMTNSKLFKNVLSFTNCDGIVSSLQFTNVNYPRINNFDYQIIQVSKNDGYSHTLIFDGLGFQNVTNAIPFLVSNELDNNESSLIVIIDNFYYPGTDYIYTQGSVFTSISITHIETEGMNIITPSPTPTESPTQSASESPSETPTESPLATPEETPNPTIADSLQPSEDLFTLSMTEMTEMMNDMSTEMSLEATNPIRDPSTPTPIRNPSITTPLMTEIFNPDNNVDRSISNKPNIGLIVGCTIAGIILIIAIVLIVLFCCVKKVPCCACCTCCEKTAFQPSDDESKTELCFFDEKLNQTN